MDILNWHLESAWLWHKQVQMVKEGLDNDNDKRLQPKEFDLSSNLTFARREV